MSHPQCDDATSGLCVFDAGFEAASDIQLLPLDGPAICCHSALLRARCKTPPTSCAGSYGHLSVQESSDVVHTLIRWIHCGILEGQFSEDASFEIGVRVAHLGTVWGLHDVDRLKSRLFGHGLVHKKERLPSTLAEDLARAYDNCDLGSTFDIVCDEGKPLYGGWWPVLAARSTFFRAMFSGCWAESIHAGMPSSVGEISQVRVHWPRAEVHRMLRFCHGGDFVTDVDDIATAVKCCEYFGIPSLSAHAHEWIASNLNDSSASRLWSTLDAFHELTDCESCMDADSACFDYHVANFESIAILPGNDADDIKPMHRLSYSLMHRLLASGLVSVPLQELLLIVREFVAEKCRQVHIDGIDALKEGTSYASVDEMLLPLVPPYVLFNKQIRASLLGGETISARTFVAGL